MYAPKGYIRHVLVDEHCQGAMTRLELHNVELINEDHGYIREVNEILH